MAGQSVDLGSVYATLELRSKNFNDGIDQTSAKLSSLANNTRASGAQMGAALENVAKVGMALLASATVAATALIVKNIGAAVRRVDTLNNSARTFENMGIKSDDAKKAIDNLTKSILGLPTPLDSAMRGMTALTATYGDVNKGQQVFSALNNAIIGFGGTTAMVENAITQLSQLPLDGPLDGQTWLSLRNSGLTPVIRAMSEDMGMSVGEMKAAFSSGQLKVEDFVAALVKMDKEGGGGMKSLETIAKDATKGIGTSFANMNTAIARGVGNIIKAIGAEGIADGINKIGKAFETALSETSSFVTFVKANKDFILPILLSIGTFITLTTILWGALKVGTAVTAVFNAVLAANPIMLVVIAVAALAAGLTYFFTQTETGRAAFQKISDAFKKFWELIKPIRDFITAQLTSAFESLKSIWAQLVETMQPLIDIFQEFWSKHGDKVVTVLKYIGIAIGAVVIAPLVAGFALFLAGLKVVSAVLGFVAKHFDTIKTVIMVLLAVAFAPLILAVGLVIGAFKLLPPVLSWLWSVMQTVWNGIVTAWNAIYAVVSTVVTAVWTVISTVFNTVWAVISFVLELIKNLFIIVFGSILIVVLTVVNGVWNVISTVFNAIWTFLEPIINKVVEFFKERWETLKANVEFVFNALKDFFTKVWDTIYGIISGIVNKIINFFAPALSWLYEKGKSVIQGLINGIVNMATGVWNAIKSVADQIGNFFSGVGSWLYNSGKALFEGFINGMKAIGNKVKETAEGIVKKVRDLLPFSPAKDGPFSGKGWTRYSGQALIKGFVQGMQDVQSLPKEMMNDIFSGGVGVPSYNNNSGAASSSNSLAIYGDINIGNQQDADYLLSRLSRRQDLTTNGLVGA